MKNNIVIFLLGLVAVCSLGYIAYDAIFKEEKVECKECEKCQECNKEELCDKCESNNNNNTVTADSLAKEFYNNLKKKRTYSMVNRGHYVDFLLDKNGNVYYRPKAGIEIGSKTTNSLKTYTFNDYETNFGDDHTYTGRKLDISNVLMVYSIEFGNAGDDYAIFIKENGSVGIIGITYTYEELEILEFKDNIQGLKNIVSVVSNDYYDGFDNYLVDINGSRYPLNNYIK